MLTLLKVPLLKNMKKLLSSLKPIINEGLFQKDPYSSELGLTILKSSIELIDTLGLEHFNFKKLAKQLNTTESSIYRYFENKHKLLIYLSSWYWHWLEYRLMYSVTNISDLEEKLKRTIHVLVFPIEGFDEMNGFDMRALKRIIIRESSKGYLTKEVDEENKEGFFKPYKSFCNRVASIVKELNPEYEFPNSLVSIVLEGIHSQKFFKIHLPALNDTGEYENLERMFFDLIVRTTEK